MRHFHKIYQYYPVIVLSLLLSLTACKKKDDSAKYVKALAELAAQYNSHCPKDEANGTQLKSVAFEDNTVIFRLGLSDQAINMVNLDSARASIIQNMSGKLKRYLVKGNCSLQYKYISPNDSSSVTILPGELGYAEGEATEE